MEDECTIKESDEISKECSNLTDSPYVGGNKMSSSLKKRLKCVRMLSSPLARPSHSTFTVPAAPRSIKFASLTDVNVDEYHDTYSKEDIEKAMNEPEPEIIENAGVESDQQISSTENALEIHNSVISVDDSIINENISVVNEITWNEMHSKINKHFTNKLDSEKSKNTMDQPDPEKNENAINKTGENTMKEIVNKNAMNNLDPEINKNITNEAVDETEENTMDKPCPEINDSAGSYFKHSVQNSIGKPHAKINENVCSYSKEDIENCVDKEKLLEIYSNLQKEAAKNEELLRKLKLVQKYRTKNDPDALTDLTKKWLTCTQLALRKLYSLVPVPSSLSFENFLIFLQVDFDIVKYNPESDTFS